MTAIDQGTIDYRNEILRKSIHLCSLSIPIVYYFVTKELALTVLIPLALISLILEIGRYFYPPIGRIFYLLFDFLLREHEKNDKKKTLNGATYVLIAAVIMVFFFPKVFVITSFAVLILGDIAAALFGRKFGKHKFLAKSLEGTIAFFAIACIVVLFAPKVDSRFLEYLIGFTAVGIGAIAENISYGWADDNLTIPLSVGLSMWILYLLLLPDMTLILPNVPN